MEREPEPGPTDSVFPRPSATVVLLREGAGSEIEVLMLKRPAHMPVFAGVWVFPGGKVAPADLGAAARSRIVIEGAETALRGLRDLAGGRVSANEALAFWAAGCRETFEEAGVLLAQHADGSACEPEVLSRFRKRRAEIVADAQQFYVALAEEDLTILAKSVLHWGHWVTPPLQRARFNTHFFVAVVAAQTELEHDARESAAAEWRPLAALAREAEAAPSSLLGPTAITILELTRALVHCGGLAQLATECRGREVLPVMPKMHRDAASLWMLLPWDRDYAQLAGDGSQLPTDFPDRYLTLPSRLPLAAPPQPPG